MIETITITNKVFVKEFYRLNAGFFLLVITLTFGFMSGVEHRALGEMFVSSWQLLFVPFFLWLIYLAKVINFNYQRLQLAENTFLSEMRLLSDWNKFSSLTITLFNQFAPALAYGAFLIFVAVDTQQLMAVFQVIIFLLVLIGAGSYAMVFKLKNPHQEIRVTRLKRFVDHKFAKPLPQFFVEWVLRREPLLCVGTKAFSCLLIFAVSSLYASENYDGRLMGMGVVVVFASNMMIVSQLHRFENFHFALLRSLPFSLTHRIRSILIVLSLICIPELVFLARFLPDQLDWIDYIALALEGISMLLFFYAVILARLHKESFSRMIFGVVIASVFMILSYVPLFLLILVNIAATILLYRNRFYQFEYPADEA